MIKSNESKVQYLKNAPKCVHCKKLYSLKKMNENQISLTHNTGLCSVCQAKQEILINFILPKKESVSAAKQAKAIFLELVENNKINENMLASLCDKDFTLKNLGGIKYAFLKKIDNSIDIKAQAYIKNKARYSTKVMIICNEQFLMVNDIYERNLVHFKKWAEQFN